VAYQVLTQKWRPQVFQEVVGQDHIMRTLINSISLNRVAHAYLFAGPHGTGKTSTARILSKALNCEKGPTPFPCNQCSRCLEIIRGEFLDVLEIDGASNRGIDEMRSLRERVSTSPMKGRFKVYIIDEVHMLTSPAFNALLKTIEEPPSHVVFIFATTDPEKLPLTIISRCQRFDFKRIGSSDIVARLEQIVVKEKISATHQSLQLIARASENSMRDAQKFLDQLTSYAQEGIKEEDVRQVLGLVEAEYLTKLTDNLFHHDSASNIKLLHQLLKKGKTPQWIVKDWLNWMRDLVMFKLGGKELLLFSSSYREIIETQSSYFTVKQLIDYIEQLCSTERKIRFSSTPYIHLEVLMIKLCSVNAEVKKIKLKGENSSLAALYDKIIALEKKIAAIASVSSPEGYRPKNVLSEKKRDDSSYEGEKKENDKKENDKKENILSSVKELNLVETEVLDRWKTVIQGVKTKNKTLGSFLEKMKILSLKKDLIILGHEANFLKETLEKRENKELVYKELKKIFSEKFSLKFKQIISKKNQEKKSSSLQKIVAQAVEIFEGEIISV